MFFHHISIKSAINIYQRIEKDEDVFISRIITGDDSWVHHYDPLTKRLSTEHHQMSPRKKNSSCRLLRIELQVVSSETVKGTC
jgi:predicted transcriptional regulator